MEEGRRVSSPWARARAYDHEVAGTAGKQAVSVLAAQEGKRSVLFKRRRDCASVSILVRDSRNSHSVALTLPKPSNELL